MGSFLRRIWVIRIASQYLGPRRGPLDNERILPYQLSSVHPPSFIGALESGSDKEQMYGDVEEKGEAAVGSTFNGKNRCLQSTGV